MYSDWCTFAILYESFEQYTQDLQNVIWQKLTELTVKRIGSHAERQPEDETESVSK